MVRCLAVPKTDEFLGTYLQILFGVLYIVNLSLVLLFYVKTEVV
jgi:hypothetical protein